MDEKFAQLTVVELRKVLKSRGLSESYKIKTELVSRLIESIEEGETIESILQILSETEESESDSSNDEGKFRDSFTGIMANHILFKDVDESMDKFSGEDEKNVESWIGYFEAVATTCKWDANQKYLFARKLLTGAAKLAVKGDVTVVTYEKLLEVLRAEFHEDVSTIDIIEKLEKRKKAVGESYLEYFYEMRRIGKDKLDEISMVKYIVNGIQDSVSNKAILYDASSLKMLREKLKTYETMRKQRDTQRDGQSDSQVKKKFGDKKSFDQKHSTSDSAAANSNVKRCYNCGSKSHKSFECPEKSKGSRCFNCNKFGHVAKECKEEKHGAATSTSQTKPVRLISTIPKAQEAHIYAQCGLDLIYSMIDSGSWVTLMRETMFRSLKHKPILKYGMEPFKGFGDVITRAIGSFDCLLTIEGDTYDTECYVVKDDHIPDDLVVGLDIINQASLSMERGKVTMKKLVDECEVNDGTFINRIKEINCVVKSNEPDLSNIQDEKSRETIREMVANYSPKIPENSCVQLKVCLTDEVPVYEKLRRLSPKEKQIVNGIIQQWLEEGICRPSKSDFASAVILRPKKTPGTWRLCIDFRRLNRKVIRDRFPLPIMDDVIDILHDGSVFSNLDLVDGFFHVDVDEDSVKYLSFIVPDGHYEFLKAPFGFANSPAVFQRLINTVFKALMHQRIVAVYLDDLSVAGMNEEDNIEKLKSVLAVAENNGLKINWRKCKFLANKITFLGFILEGGTIKPSDEKTIAVRKFPPPNNVLQVQRFLGLTGFFRRFIRNYATIARPLTDLTKKDVNFEFSDEQQEAFITLKAMLCDNPVLKMYNPAATKTEVHTDASKLGFGAVLLQRDSEDQKMHPVYYISYKTTPAQQKYESYDLETFAIYKALKKLRIYLLGLKFEVFTDCQAFERSMLKKELIPRIAKWALYISQFECELVHKPGTRMQHVDALSRIPRIMLIEDGLLARVKQMQQKDDRCKTILKILETKSYEDFTTRGGILYRWADGNNLLVVPKKIEKEIIRSIHEKGHINARKVETMVKRDYFIDKLNQKVTTVIANCIACILANRKDGKKDGLLNPIDKGDVPLHTYHLDHLGPLKSTAKNYNQILAVTDAFSKYTWIYPVKSTDVDEVLQKLESQRVIFGNPHTIIADKAGAFISKKLEVYCKEHNINLHLITTGVPRGSGQVERMNRIIVPMLTKLSNDDPEKWFRHTSRLQTFMNSTTTRSTGKTPFEMLFGVEMRTDDDQILANLLEEALQSDFMERRQEMRQTAKKSIAKLQEENRKSYNRNRKPAMKYRIGDLVAIERTQLGGGLKLKGKFLGPYEVTQIKRNDRYGVTKIGQHEGPNITSTAADLMKPWATYEDEDTSSSSEADDWLRVAV